MGIVKSAQSTALLLALLFYLFATAYPTEECDQGISVVSPKLALPGRTTAVLVTLHGTARQRALNVTLRVLMEHVEEMSQLLAETSQEIRGHGIIPLMIPAGASGSCILQTLVNCSASDECNLQSSSELRLVGSVRDVIIRPGRKSYRPGDTVDVWILALDHDLKLALDTSSNVCIRNPQGTKVALWKEVPLDEGVKSFSLPLSEMASLGQWTVEVEVDGGAVFSSLFNVSLTGGVSNNVIPEVPMAEEHYVELRFGHETRRLYKPGLPFVGRVEAVSTEKCVRVRVKVYDDTIAIYSQDIEITSGEGRFVVPAILADSDVITLQAELVSVDGKEIDSHYVLAKEPIRKWNSSSDCYLLIEGVENTLKPDEEAHAAILSTCPCEKDIHYVITTEGRVTFWSDKPYEVVSDPPNENIDGAAICRVNFSFVVKPMMAPVSQLLVYYLTEDGEPISDVISFDVQLLMKQVSIVTDTRETWYPNQEMNVQVKALPGSLVCLVGGHALSTSSDSRTHSKQLLTRRKRHYSSVELDFQEASVVFFQRQCIQQDPDSEPETRMFSAENQKNRKNAVASDSIDQVWIWKCFNHTHNENITVFTPDDPGKWSLWAVTLAPDIGLRLSEPVSVTVFKPLQVDFHLPHSLKVGEVVEVDVKIGNNINSCMDVTALLSLTEGSHFLSNGMLYVTEKLRLGPHGATSLVVRVVVTSAGVKNLTVEVLGYSSENCKETNNGSNSTLAGSVILSDTVLVHPEGLVRTHTESAYFCANENMVLSTRNDFTYEFVSAPRNRAGLVFDVKVSSGAYIALSDVHYSSSWMYQIVIGDNGNTVTWIGRGKHGYDVHLISVDTPNILSADTFRTFWISWELKIISLGIGPILYKNSLLKWRLNNNMKIQHVGFASAWGKTAEFRIWNYNDEAGYSQVLHLETPRQVVPGSEQGNLMITGGLALPTLFQQTSSLHHGLGLAETTSLAATISSFTPLLVLEHLHKLQNESFDKAKLIESLNKKIQVLLSFMKPDYSFGDHNILGSHRSTVNVLHVLTKLQQFVSVDPDLITGVKHWLQQRQSEDGSFLPLPTDSSTVQDIVISTSNDSATALLDQKVEITAETLSALISVGLENEVDLDVALKARYFLERNLFRVTSPCPLSLLTFALVLSNSDMISTALDRLQNASTNEEGDFGWQAPLPIRDAPDWLYEERSGRHRKEPIMTSVSEYKASLYALITYSLLGDLKSAEPVSKYLFYRSHLLDNHIELLYPAVKALAMSATLGVDRHRVLTLSLATSGMELTDTLELRPDSLPQSLQLPSLPTKVFVYATGAGCATVQGQVSYSTYSPVSHTTLLDLWAGVEDEVIPGHTSIEQLEGKLPLLKLKTCFRWNGLKPSGVLRLEVTLFSGFELESVSPVVIDSSGTTVNIHYNTHADKIWFVLANVTDECPLCIRYNVRSLFVVSSLRPAFARIYPVERADLGAETFFHTRRGSPLLADITDDDIITWFGNSDAGGLHLSSNFSEVCECGRVCTSTTTQSSTVEENNKHVQELTKMEATNIVIVSNITDNNNTTDSPTETTSIDLKEIIISLETTSDITYEIQVSTEGSHEITYEIQVSTEGSHDISTENTAMNEMPTEFNTTVATIIQRNKKTGEETTTQKLVTETNSEEAEKTATVTKEGQKITGSTGSTEHSLENITITVTELQPSKNFMNAIPNIESHYINKEKHHVKSHAILPTPPDEMNEIRSLREEKKETMFEIKHDSLWNILKEDSHIDYDRKSQSHPD